MDSIERAALIRGIQQAEISKTSKAAKPVSVNPAAKYKVNIASINSNKQKPKSKRSWEEDEEEKEKKAAEAAEKKKSEAKEKENRERAEKIRKMAENPVQPMGAASAAINGGSFLSPALSGTPAAAVQQQDKSGDVTEAAKQFYAKKAQENAEKVKEARMRQAHDSYLQSHWEAKIKSMPENERQALDRYISMNAQLKAGQGVSPEQAYDEDVNALMKKYGNDLTTMADTIERQRNKEQAESLEKLGRQATQYKAPQIDEVTAKALADMGMTPVPVSSRGLAEGAAVAGNLIGSAAQGIENFGQSVAQIAKGAYGGNGFQTVDPNAGGKFTAFSSGVRQQNLEDIAASENLGETGKAVASLLYQGGTSAMDNLARAAVGGGAEFLSLGLAGLGSFGSAVSEASANGATPTQALGNGIVQGALEILTEQIPLDNILDSFRNPSGKVLDFVVKTLKNSVSEITEEEVSLIAGTIAQAAILQGASDRSQAVARYIESGMTPEEAYAQANRDLIQEAVNTAITTSISSTASTAASQAAGKLANLNAGGTENSEENAPLTRESADRINDYYGRRYDAQEQLSRNRDQAERAAQQTEQERNNPVNRAVEALKENGKISNREAEAVASDPAALQRLGIDPAGKTKSQVRAEIKAAIADSINQQDITEETAGANAESFQEAEAQPKSNPFFDAGKRAGENAAQDIQPQKTADQLAADRAAVEMFRDTQQKPAYAQEQQGKPAEPYKQGNKPTEEVSKKKPKVEKGKPQAYQETKTTKETIAEIKERVAKIRSDNKLSFEQAESLHYSDASLARIGKNVVDSTGRTMDAATRAELTKKLSDFYKTVMSANTDDDSASIEAQTLAEWIDAHSGEGKNGKDSVESIMTKLVENAEKLSNEGALPGKAGEYQRELKQTRQDDAKQARDIERNNERVQKQTDAEWERSTREAINDAKSETAKAYKMFMESQDTWMETFKQMEEKYRGDIDALKKALEKQAKESAKDSKQMLEYYNQVVNQYQKAGEKIGKLEQRIDDIKEMYKAKQESKQRTTLKHEIVDKAKEIDKMFNRNDIKLNIPDSLKAAVATARDAFDTTIVDYQANIDSYDAKIAEAKANGDFDAIESLATKKQQQIDRMENNNARLADLKNSLADMIKSNSPEANNINAQAIMDIVDATMLEIGDTPVYKMDANQLKAVSDMYSEVLHRIKDEKKAFRAAANMTAQQASQEAIDSIKDRADKKDDSGGIVSKAKDALFGINNDKPIYAAERIGSPILSQTMYELAVNGDDAKGKQIHEIKSIVDEVNSRHDVKNLDLDKNISVKDKNGEFVDIPASTALALYAYKDDPSAMTHLEGRGVYLIDKDGKRSKTAHSFDAAAMESIGNMLSDEQKAYAKDYYDSVFRYTADKVNEVTLEQRGVSIATKENYAPIFAVFEGNRPNITADNYVSYMGYGGLNARQNSSSAIEVGDFRYMAARHADQATTYTAYASRLADLHRLLNYTQKDGTSLKSEISRVYGDSFNKYVQELETDLLSKRKSDSRTALLNTTISNTKKAATFFNINTIAQQHTAIYRAMSVIDAKYFAGSKVDEVGNYKAEYEQMSKYCGIATIKDMGTNGINSSMSVVDYLMPQEEKGKIGKAVDWAVDAPGRQDAKTWVKIWEAAKRQVSATTNLKGEAMLEEAGKLASRAFAETQVYDSALTKNANMRSNDLLMKSATAFMSEAVTSENMVRSGFNDIKAAIEYKDKGLAEQGAKKIASVGASTLANSLIVALVKTAARSFKDKDKSILEKFVENFTGELINGFNPLMYHYATRSVFALASGTTEGRFDLSLFSNLIRSYSSFTKLLQKDTSEMTEEELAKHEEDLFLAGVNAGGNLIGIATGVNPAIAIRDVYGLVRTALNKNSWKLPDKQSLLDAVQDEIAKVPGIGKYFKETQKDRLYDAVTGGDDKYLAAVTSQYGSLKELQSALRTTLRNHDPRIGEAAAAFERNDTAEYERIMAEIKAEGHFDSGVIKGAVAAEVEARKPKDTKDYTDKQIDTVSQFSQWGKFDKLPVSVQGKMEELAYSKTGVEKYSTPQEFAAAAYDASISGIFSDITKNWETNPNSKKYFKDLNAAYESAEQNGLLKEVMSASDGTVKKYLEARQAGMDTETFMYGLKAYKDAAGGDDKEITNKEKANAFVSSIDSLREDGLISDSDAEFFKDTFKVYNQVAQTTSQYDEISGKYGFKPEDARALADGLAKISSSIKGETGETPSKGELYKGIHDSGIAKNDATYRALLQAVTPDYSEDGTDTSSLKVDYLFDYYGLTGEQAAYALLTYYDKTIDDGEKAARINSLGNGMYWFLQKGGRTAKRYYGYN